MINYRKRKYFFIFLEINSAWQGLTTPNLSIETFFHYRSRGELASTHWCRVTSNDFFENWIRVQRFPLNKITFEMLPAKRSPFYLALIVCLQDSRILCPWMIASAIKDAKISKHAAFLSSVTSIADVHLLWSWHLSTYKHVLLCTR